MKDARASLQLAPARYRARAFLIAVLDGDGQIFPLFYLLLKLPC